MMYTAMRKLIDNQNVKYDNGYVTKDEYKAWQEDMTKKLDVFLAFNRLTIEQYQELMNSFKKFDEPE